MWGVLQTLFLLLYIVLTVGTFLVLIVLALLKPDDRAENLLCVARIVVFFALSTTVAALLLHSSSYQIYWTASRWHWGEGFSPIPATITSDSSTLVGASSLIPKTSSRFWWMAALGIGLYFTFPQAVLRAVNLRFPDEAFSFILGTLAFLFGGGVAIVSVLIPIDDITTAYIESLPHHSPLSMHVANIWVELACGYFLVLLAGLDLGGMPGIGSYIVAAIARPILMWQQRITVWAFYLGGLILGARESWILGNNAYAALTGAGKVVAHASAKSPPVQTGPFVLAILVGILVLGGSIGLMFLIRLMVAGFCAFLGIEILTAEGSEAAKA